VTVQLDEGSVTGTVALTAAAKNLLASPPQPD